MRKAPLVLPAVALIGGLLAAHHLPLDPRWGALLAALGIVAAALMLLVRAPRTAKAAAVATAALGIGTLLGSRTNPAADPSHWSHHCQQRTLIAVELHTMPQPTARSLHAEARVLSVGGQTTRGTISLLFASDSAAATLRSGDRLLLHGSPDTLRRSLYVGTARFERLSAPSRSLRSRAENLRLRLLHRMQSGPLEEPHLGIAAALALGYAALTADEVRLAFRSAGIAHLLAVSGLHVGLVAALVHWLLWPLGRLRLGRRLMTAGELSAVWGFATITGLAPSAVRAALMFSLFILASASGRRTSRLNLLAASAIATLCASPALLFDLGWQLSYSAVAALLLAQPAIHAFRNPLWQGASASLAATLGTMPISLCAFRTLHPWFLVANMLLVPAAGLMLGLSLLYLLLPYEVAAAPLRLVLAAAGWVAEHAAALPGANISF